MEAIAKIKHLKGSPRKARLVIDLIRGEDVSRALAILKFTDKRAADPIAKCLNSAIANATYLAEQQNIAVDPDDLWVKSCFVDMGAHKNRRRMRPAPQGRAYREQRHYCHITIAVTSEEKPKTEKELKAEAAIAKRGTAPKKEKKKDPVIEPHHKKEHKHATEEVVEETIHTPVEPTAQDIVEALDIASEPVEELENAADTQEAASEDAEKK
jgi:large subunit ribosomal protein L22